MMKINNLKKRVACMALAVLMMVTAVPVNGFVTIAHAAQEDGLCAHHTVHEGCGYVESAQPCGNVCSECEAEAALDQATDLFAALPEASSITDQTTEVEKDAVFAQLELAMEAYDALLENYPEQAAIFEETQLALIQNALALNDALTGNVAQTYAHYSYEPYSWNNVTITVEGDDNNKITGAQITVTHGSDTFEVVEIGNGQYRFTKRSTSGNYNITVSAAGYESKTATMRGKSTSIDITLEESEDLTGENPKTFKVFYIATGQLPDSYAGAGDESDYGPSGSNTPLAYITVDINKLRREHSDVVRYQENTDSNNWEFTPVGAAKDMDAVAAFWNAVWACMTEESKADFTATGFANDFYGYVLKQQKNGSSQHCDGILTKEPPVYVIELYQQGVYLGGSVTDGDDAFKKMDDVRDMCQEHLHADITWTSNSAGTYSSGGRIYTVTLTQSNKANAVTIRGSEIPYESKNSTNTYYLAKFAITVTEGAEGYYTVTYTDGMETEMVFEEQVKTVQSGSAVPAFEGTPDRKEYAFRGWMQEDTGAILSDEQIANMKVTKDLAFHAVWEAIPTSFTGTVNVLLNDAYPADITTLLGAGTALYVSKDGANYTKLESSALGVYAAELENGVWYLYYSKDGASYTKVDDGSLVINNAPAARELYIYSVSYDLNGGKMDATLSTGYYIKGTQVNVTDLVPEKDDYRFVGWKAGETVYRPESVLTGNMGKAYTLVAQWEKTVSVTIHVTIDHQGGDGVDKVDAKDDVYLELVSKANASAPFLETDKDLTLNDSNCTGFDYVPTYGSGETDGVVIKTEYKANSVTFKDLPGGTAEYSVVASKTGYDTSVTTEQDAEGNWTIHVKMEFKPDNFDIRFEVKVDEDVPKAYMPTAAIVKVTFWNGEAWEWITQQAGGAPGVRVNIDPESRSGFGTYPVWKMPSGRTKPYGYRVIVTAFVYPNGTIVPAAEVDPDTAWGDKAYLATLQVTGGDIYGSKNGAYFDGTVQQGSLVVTIDMDLHDVTFHAMGGTILDKAEHTVEDQYKIPTLSGYTPVREGGYIFEGWYTKDGTQGDWGEAAQGGTDLTQDVTLYAKWKAPMEVSGTVYVAGSYEMDGNTHYIHDADRAKTVMILLRKQGYTGVYDTKTVNITYGDDHIGVGTYSFTGLADDGTVYYIEERAVNFGGLYLNEPESRTVTKDFSVYKDEKNIALLDGDQIAQVNVYMPFAPESFDLTYSVDATAIASAFRPDMVEMLVTYDADHTITDPAKWPVISQMVFGKQHQGDELTLSEGQGSGSTSVWSSNTNGATNYDYGICVDTVTGSKLDGYANAPYTITYQAPAHQVSGGQSKELIATLTPNRYNITYELGMDINAVNGMEAAPKKHTWSFDTDLSKLAPQRIGYAFLGWYDNADFAGAPVTRIDAAVAKDTVLYAKWQQMMDVVDLSVTVIHKTPDGKGEAGNYDKQLLVQLTHAKEGSTIYEAVTGQRKTYGKDVWHTQGDDADEETLQVKGIFKGLPYDYAYNLNVTLDGYYASEKTVETVVDPVTGATTYQVDITLQYNPDLLNFTFGVEMAPGIEQSLWPESAEVRVTCWYDHPSTTIGLDWNTITQHETGSVTVQLDSTGKGTGSYPVWQWLDKSQNLPYYYRIEVVSLHLSDGSIVMTNGNGSEHDVVYRGGDYSATVETKNCVVPDGTTLDGAYGQGSSNVYAQIGEVKAVISIDRWSDVKESDQDSDGIHDHQQALVLFRSADETKGTLSGKLTQVFTLNQNGSSYTDQITPDTVIPVAKTDEGFVFSHWTNEAGETVNPFLERTAEGGHTYVYTANWKYNEELSYRVQYLDKDTKAPLKKETVTTGITYGTVIQAAKEAKNVNIDGYVYDYAEESAITVGMGENVLKLYYAVDELDDVHDGKSNGDRIADYKQVVIEFNTGDNGSVTGKTIQVITLTDETEGVYTGKITPETVTITPDDHYIFAMWTLPGGETLEAENAPYAQENALAVEGGKTYTYEVSWKAKTYTYQVRYLERDGEAVLADAVTKTLVYDGMPHKEAFIEITGYHLAGDDTSEKTVAYADGQVITFYYEKNIYDLVVHFTDMDGNELHEDVIVGGFRYLETPLISALTNMATIPGYTYVESDPAQLTIKDPTHEGIPYNEITLKYDKNRYDLTVLYYFDNVLSQSEPPKVKDIPYGTKISDVWAHENAFVKSGQNYVLDKVVGTDTTITDVENLNVVRVYYLSDTLVDNTDEKITPEPDGIGDGIPDIYQATVLYEIINGTWKGESETTLQYVFTLYTKEVDGTWTKLTAPTLGDTVPTGEPNSGFEDLGAWNPAEPKTDTKVLGDADYVLAYTSADVNIITVTVVNGTAAVDGTEKTATHFFHQVAHKDFVNTDVDETVLTFTPANMHLLYSVTVDGVAVSDPAMVGGVYTHVIHHDADHSIVVVFEQDAVGDIDSNGEDVPDNIPDKYQKRINYQIVNGTWDGTASADEHIYVTLMTGDAYDVNGTAQLTDPHPGTKMPNAGYVDKGSWTNDKEQPVTFPVTVSGLQEETFVYSYNEKQKIKITIEVVGGTSLPRPSETVYEYTTEKTTIQFEPYADHIFDSATVNGAQVLLTNNTYEHDYTQELHIKVVYKMDRWNDDTNSETEGDQTPDEEQALVKFFAGENGSVSGATTQVFTLGKDSNGNYAQEVDLENVVVNHADGYRLLYWQDTSGHTYSHEDLFGQKQYLEGGKQYTFTAIFEKNVFNYTVEYYFDGILDTSRTEHVPNVVYQTQITLNPANRTGDQNRYMLERVEPATLTVSHISEENVIKVYYVTDQWDNGYDKETGGDDIADYQQALIRFVTGGNGTLDGTTSQIFDLVNNNGVYSSIVVPSAVMVVPDTGYRFSHWETAGQEADPYQPTTLTGGQEITYTAHFVKDSFGYRVETYYDGVLTDTEIGEKKEFESFVEVDPLDRVDAYMLETVDPANKTLKIGAEEDKNVIRIYYVKDIWKDAPQNGEDSQTEGDNIPDYQQVLVNFVPADENGSVTGSGVSQVFTLPAGEETMDVTPLLDEVVAKGNPGYAFDYWTKGIQLQHVHPGQTLTDVPGGTVVTFKAHFAQDVWKDSAKTPEDDTDSKTGGDNIPDNYQAIVTYIVENGTWSDGTEEAIKEVFTLYSWSPADCNWINVGVTLGDTVPQDMMPAAGYVAEGYWEQPDTTDDDPVPETPVTKNAAYTYCYGERMKFNITVTVENGRVTPEQTTIQVVYGEDQTLSFQPNSGYTLDVVTVDGTEATLTDGTYSFENVTADHDIHVVYSVDNWKDSQQTPEDDTDGEEGGDGIPDHRQALVEFQADENGTIEGKTWFVVTLPEKDGAFKGPFSVKKDEVSAKADAGYVFEQWNLTVEPMARTVTADVDPYTEMELQGGYYYLFSAQFGEDIRHVDYPEADPEDNKPDDITVPVQNTKYIQVKPNGGLWRDKAEDQTIQINQNYTLEDPVREGFLFVGWTRADGEDEVIHVFTAQWEKDETGNLGDDGKDTPDSIPDKHQKKVVFKIENGYWKQGTDTDIVVWLTLTDKDGNWDEKGSAKLEIPTGMYAKDGYGNGAWDVVPTAEVTGTDELVFTYRFVRNPVSTDNPNTGDVFAERMWFYVAGMLLSAAALVLMAAYRPKKRKVR